MKNLRYRFPRIGMRIIKSALAVGLCCLIYYYGLGHEDIPFFFVIAAMQCMQPYSGGIKDFAKRNIYGTLIGAVCGLVIILIQHFVLAPYSADFVWFCLLMALGIACTIYTAVVLNSGDIAHFACVVFICMMSSHISDEEPFLYVLQRITETLLGIAVGTGINALHLPRRKTEDTLFVASLDEILHSEVSHLSDYSKVELNRILDEGIPLSVMTRHSAASLHESGTALRFRLPVILLDGAAIYDSEERSYVYKSELSYEESMEIAQCLQSLGLDVFKTAIMDDTMLVFYDKIQNTGSRIIYENLRRSPYRNYINLPLPEGTPTICLHAVNTREKMAEVYHELISRGYGERFKISCYRSQLAEGYSYIRIFSKQADRKLMVEKLRELSGLSKVKTFGNDPQLYDVHVSGSEGEGIIKCLKKEFRPYAWKKK